MRPQSRKPTHIIWPEAAPPFILTRSAYALDEIAVLTGQDRVLMTGALRGLQHGDHMDYYNSFYVFGHGGEMLGVYDKFHLVPFGEYLPLESFLKKIGLTKVVGIDGSFATGDGPHVLNIPGAPQVGPLICYEILFPDGVVGADATGMVRQCHRRFVVRSPGRDPISIFSSRACGPSNKAFRLCVRQTQASPQ